MANIFDNIKWFFQRLFRGYTDIDFADLGIYICKKTLPILKAWINSERHGFPEEFGTKEKWDETLKEILWAVNETANNTEEDLLFVQARRYGWQSEYLREKLEENWARQEKGMELFGKYLPAMWE